jgi:hypothetical protein
MCVLKIADNPGGVTLAAVVDALAHTNRSFIGLSTDSTTATINVGGWANNAPADDFPLRQVKLSDIQTQFNYSSSRM